MSNPVKTPTLYRIFNLCVASDLALPLPVIEGEPVVEIVEGAVTPRGAALWRAEPPFAFACFRDDDAIVLDWPEARFRVAATRVVVDASDRIVAAGMLVPAVWSVVMAARGVESLHGCAVARAGRAVAVLGASGAGKSSAGLAMLDRDWHVVTDDLLVLDDAGRAVPGPPFLRLCTNGEHGRAGEPDAGGKLRVATPGVPAPVPLTGMVILHDDYTECVRLRGSAAVAALLDQVYAPMVTHADQSRRRFELAVDLAARTAVFGAPPRSLTPETIERIAQENAA